MIAGCGSGGELQDSKWVEVRKVTPNTIQLDEGHNSASGGDSVPYVIDATKTLNIDPNGYTIPILPGTGISVPNSIHLTRGTELYFRTPWDGKTPVTLSASTLTNLQGKGAFPGFQPEERWILGIGKDTPDNKLQLAVMWAATIKVAPKPVKAPHASKAPQPSKVPKH